MVHLVRGLDGRHLVDWLVVWLMARWLIGYLVGRLGRWLG